MFVIDDSKIDEAHADELYDQFMGLVQKPQFRPRALFDSFGIEVLATTDDPLDTLEPHDRVAADESEIIGALSDPRAADDVRRLWELLAAPSTAVVTLTITWAAYNLGPELSFDAAEDCLLDDVAQATGFADQAPVVTEPFSSWVLQGEFPAGRSEWERAGAVFVEDLEPCKRRKLWLLNGAHSLLAYAGQLRGHETVEQAITDEVSRQQVLEFWDEAAHHLTTPGLDVPAYREALLERFENPRIRHNLAQIAGDGSTKLQKRAVPVLKAERSAGRSGEAAARMIAAWTVYVDGRDEHSDSRADQVLEASRSEDRIRALVGLLDAQLAEQPEVIEQITDLAQALRD